MTPLPATEPRRLAAPLALAVGFAAAELGAALLIGRLFDWGRAEGLMFLAFRPWWLFMLALALARSRRRERLATYMLALLVAGLSESLLLLSLGGNPWVEMIRGWAAGAALAAAFDLLVQGGRRLAGGWGQLAAAAAGAALLVLPGALRPYEMLALGSTAAAEAADKPPLLLMTGLPLVWGEGGAFDPSSRPAAAYSALEREFEVRPIDYLDSAALEGKALMLLAQPRMLEPTELVALDSWVRSGGGVLVLADPTLLWPTRLPLGDPRRPPPTSLLAPLLGHWGLRLEAKAEPRMEAHWLRSGGQRRRLSLAAPGRFVGGGACRVSDAGFLAACRIGRGQAWLLADADLLHDSTWTAPMVRGDERHARLADNPLVVADLLDRLAGVSRQRAAAPVQWQAPGADRGLALLAGAAPILAALAAALLAASRRPS